MRKVGSLKKSLLCAVFILCAAGWNENAASKVQAVELVELPEIDPVYAGEDLIIPEGTKVIEDNQFYNMQFTGKLVIPEGVTHIGDNAFFLSGFTGELVIPDTVKSIGDHAFWGCNFTGDLVIPDSVEEIGDCAFAFCNSFNDGAVVLGKKVSIGDDAFYYTACENIYIAGEAAQYPYTRDEKADRVFVNADGKEITIHAPIESSTRSYVSDWNMNNSTDKLSFAQWEGRYDAETMTFDKSFMPMQKGESKKLLLTILPKIAADQTIYWSSSDTSVATVNNGVVTAVGTGVTTIAASTAGGDYATCEVVILPFTDVNVDSWEYEGICYNYGYGMMTGLSETEFAPQGLLTRSQFVMVLYSCSGKPAVKYSNYFKDVPAGQWYTDAVIWAAENGVTAGYGESFGVNDYITREQFVTMLHAYAEVNGVKMDNADGKLDAFADGGKVSSWAKKALIWATENSLLSGKPKNGQLYLDYAGNTTRADCATVMMQYDMKFGE